MSPLLAVKLLQVVSFSVYKMPSGGVLEEQVDPDYNPRSMSNHESSEVKNLSTRSTDIFNIEKAERCSILFIYMYSPN